MPSKQPLSDDYSVMTNTGTHATATRMSDSASSTTYRKLTAIPKRRNFTAIQTAHS